MKDYKNCRIETAKGYYDDIDSFKKNRTLSFPCDTNRIVAEVPTFGDSYTWRVISGGNSDSHWGLHHFSTLTSPKIDTAVTRLRIINPAKKYKDAYVFIDFMKALYDMDGNPVWFVPDSGFTINNISSIIDLKLSPKKTITLILNDKAREIDYNGNILWEGPNTGEVSGDTSEHYHHEFTMLGNNHYMIMGSEYVAWPLTDYKPDSNADADIVRDSNGTFRQKMMFGTLIEYNEQGKVVWYWKSSGYFKTSDIIKLRTANGRVKEMDVHENGFFFDENTDVIYVTCRNINEVLKVKYPGGTVTAVYGCANKEDTMSMQKALFSGQHAIRKSREGYLYLYNNNILPAGIPKITMMEEPAGENGALKKIWEYECGLEGLSERELMFYNKLAENRRRKDNNSMKIRPHFTSGGNVLELPDNSIFASMSGPSSKIFIVTKDKEILWSAIPEQKRATDTAWGAAATYRASIVTDRKELEQLIWNAEKRQNADR